MAHRIDSNVLDRERDATLRLMFERSADAILLLDAETNRFIEYNQATLDLLRCSREELSALHPSSLSPSRQPDGRESFEKANEMIAIAIRDGSHRFEWIHKSPHRADFPVEVLLTPLFAGGRQLVVTTWRDITERKRDERALLESQKMESVALLAGGVAHDFNNLLTAAMSHLYLARAQASAEVTEQLQLAERALGCAADLTRQLLAYSGRGTYVVESLDLGAIAREMTQLLRASVPRSVTLQCESDSSASIEAGRAQVQQVLINLITNAAESFEGRAGRILVRAFGGALSQSDVDRDFPGQRLSPGEFACLEVRDSGKGMSPEVLARIFEPFFSTKRAGRGLGLAALHGILRAHGAGVRVRSELGVGTTVTIAWPASGARASATGEHARDHSPATPRARERGLVLVVDDDAMVRRSSVMLLDDLGFRAIEAEDGASAVERFRAHRDAIDWVLMDVTMPQKDGYTTFLELRDLAPTLRVVLCSGWTETEMASAFRRCPPAGFLPKPFTYAELTRTLDRIGVLRADEARA